MKFFFQFVNVYYCTTMLINVCSLLLTNKTNWNLYMCKYYCNPKRYNFQFFLLSSISFSKLLSQNHSFKCSSKFCNHVNDVSFVKCYYPCSYIFLNAKLNIVIIYYSKQIKKFFQFVNVYYYCTTMFMCVVYCLLYYNVD